VPAFSSCNLHRVLPANLESEILNLKSDRSAQWLRELASKLEEYDPKGSR
jgi:hypothetical protein